MKQRQKFNKYRPSISFIFVMCVFIVSIILYKVVKVPRQLEFVSFATTPYPVQYSDEHITENAIATAPKFRQITFANNVNQFANIISSINKNSDVIKSEGPENGTWLWTPILSITPQYRKTIISNAKNRGIKNIYISIDSYLDIYVMPDGSEKIAKKKAFDAVLAAFIQLANKNGISVDAEAGWRNWAEDGNTYKAFATVNYAIEFNKNHQTKLRGFQYDVEPYLLDRYKKEKADVLVSFIKLVDQTVSQLSDSDLQFMVVIPEFYDKSSGSPKFVYKNVSGFAIDHLLSVLDQREGSKIIIMSYRNWSLGEDSSVEISQDEIRTADSHQTKIVVAQETGDVMPSYVTFHNTSRAYLKSQTTNIQKAFAKNKSFGGLAVHYINAFMELK
ncbi:MAG TPA: hypothetical protein VJC13_03275 [Candidatus Paceibacterota bacterium]